MPRLTPERLGEIARLVATDAVRVDDVWDMLDLEEREDLWALVQYEHARVAAEEWKQRTGRPQRRALALLRTILTPEQLAQEAVAHRGVDVTGSAGGTYRVYPATGAVHRVERHGTRWYRVARYCLHPDDRLPPADETLGHILLLIADEPAFLAAANETPIEQRQWDGAWRRRMNAHERERQRLGDILAAELDARAGVA